MLEALKTTLINVIYPPRCLACAEATDAQIMTALRQAQAAALMARCFAPDTMDYLVFSHRSSEPGHRMLLIHLQMQPLLDLELRMGQGLGAMMAWPILKATEQLLAED